MSPFDPAAMPALPTAGTVSPGSGAYSVANNATVTLAAGAKGDVTVGSNATLRLLGGIYPFASLTLKSKRAA